MVTQSVTIQAFEAQDGLKFIGIADCHGIETFLPYEDHKQDLWMLKIRAMANRQRHAVTYLAVLNPKLALQVKNYVDKKNFKSALIMLKCSERIYFADDYGKSWDLIPNSDLDPWRG